MVSGNSLRHGDVGGGRAGGGVDGADIHGRIGRDIAQELRLRPAVKYLAGDKERRGRDMGLRHARSARAGSAGRFGVVLGALILTDGFLLAVILRDGFLLDKILRDAGFWRL